MKKKNDCIDYKDEIGYIECNETNYYLKNNVCVKKNVLGYITYKNEIGTIKFEENYFLMNNFCILRDNILG